MTAINSSASPAGQIGNDAFPPVCDARRPRPNGSSRPLRAIPGPPVDRPAVQGADIRAGFRHMPVSGLRQFAEQRLRLFEIDRVKPLGEPAVDGGKEVAGFAAPTLVAAQPGEARGRAQFPELGPLLCGDA